MSTCTWDLNLEDFRNWKLMCSIRFAPPLVISEEDVRKAVRIIGESLEEIDVVSSTWAYF